MWQVTKERTHESNYKKAVTVDVKSSDYNEAAMQTLTRIYAFRMLTDDGEIIYEGRSTDCDSEKAFAPLDDYGSPNFGCTTIQYYSTAKGWETL